MALEHNKYKIIVPQKKQSISPQVDALQNGLSSTASTNTNNHSTNTPLAIQVTDSLKKIAQSRTIFIDLTGFYKCWRLIASDVLFDAVLILPNIHIEWILSPEKYLHEFIDILNEDVFTKLLQWKHQQGLLFCTSLKQEDENKVDGIHPFYQNVSDRLCELENSSMFKTTVYKPLIFDLSFYSSTSYQSKFNVSADDIITELIAVKNNQSAIKEILFQSNPSLNVVIEYTQKPKNHNNFTDTLTQPNSGLLDELSSDLLLTPNDHLKVINDEEDRDVMITPFDEHKDEDDYIKKMQQFGNEEIDDMLDDICAAFIKQDRKSNTKSNYILPPMDSDKNNLSVTKGSEYSMLSLTSLDSDLKFVDYDSNIE